MTLREYFDKHKATIKQNEVAKALNIHPSTLHCYITGKRNIPIAMCKKFVALTNGEVTLSDMRMDAHEIWEQITLNDIRTLIGEVLSVESINPTLDQASLASLELASKLVTDMLEAI